MSDHTPPPSSPKSITVLWNAAAGWDDKEKALNNVRAALSAGQTRVDIRQLDRGADICAESKAALEAAPDVLVAAGGDGTLNAVASSLLYQPTAFGIVPAGTLNHFARDLEIPFEPVDAAQTLVTGRTIPVDAATVNGRAFINNTVLGLFPNYRILRERWERRGLGRYRLGRWLAMSAAMLNVFWRLPRLHVRIEVDGKVRDVRTAFVMVANNEHKMEGFALGERARLDRGRLWIYVLRPCSRWALLRLLVGLLLGTVRRDAAFQVFQCSRVRIETRRRRIGIGLDGEFLHLAAPLEFQSLPGALRVVVPTPEQARSQGAVS